MGIVQNNEKLPKVTIKAEVIGKNLCCGCGACVGVCPTGVLSIEILNSHEPLIDQSKCTACGLCYEVCPGKGYPVVKLSQESCNEKTHMIPERGPVRAFLMGHSTDPDIRHNSASGGIATSVLIYLLENKMVDDVLVIGMANERPVARLTNNIQDVRDSLGSKYGPVPMLATLIPELLKEPRRIAMVATPCQLAGWIKAKDKIPKLRKSTVFTLGLFCGQVQSYDALTSIAARMGVAYPGEAKFTHWRYGAYPGSARFECYDGSIAQKPLYQCYDVAVPHFSLHRCFLCPDGGNWLADMTLGDIHSGGNDETVIVCRTSLAMEILESAQDAGKISFKKLTEDQVGKSVIKHILGSKMLPAIARNIWLRKKGRSAPEFDYDASSLLVGRKKIMGVLWVFKYRLTFWARTGWRRSFLLKYPWLMEKTGHFLYYFPVTILGWRVAARVHAYLRRWVGKR